MKLLKIDFIVEKRGYLLVQDEDEHKAKAYVEKNAEKLLSDWGLWTKDTSSEAEIIPISNLQEALELMKKEYYELSAYEPDGNKDVHWRDSDWIKKLDNT